MSKYNENFGIFVDDIKNFTGYRSVEKPPKKLLEQVRDVIRIKHYFYKTEKSYVVG